jgi:tRNA A37 threonylcarbamoyladenosine dehydratase
MDEESIFIRTERLIGAEALAELKKARVAVFGVGGVGSYVAEALARSGVGSLTLVDFDVVAPSNINRQLHALHSTLGRFKSEVMAERLKDINPAMDVNVINERFPDDGHAWPYDYIADAVDTKETKLALALTAKRRGIPLIASMGAGNRLDPMAFKVADIYATAHCPLAKAMRGLYRKHGIVALKVVYSSEVPVKGITGIGSAAFVPSAAGLLIASEIIKDLTNGGLT